MDYRLLKLATGVTGTLYGLCWLVVAVLIYLGFQLGDPIISSIIITGIVIWIFVAVVMNPLGELYERLDIKLSAMRRNAEPPAQL